MAVEDAAHGDNEQPSFMNSSLPCASSSIFRKPSIASEQSHTMGSSLPEYLRMKVHPIIQNGSWPKILVTGQHQRDSSIVHISPIEKCDKPFNWQRPTALLIDSQTLEIHCFPGFDYERHYAAIIATYLSLKGRDHNTVLYTLPSQQECMKPILNSNLAEMGSVDIVIVGYVHGLERWTEGSWDSSHGSRLFSWKKSVSKRGYSIAFLGCRVSFWGDIAGNIVRALQRLNRAQCVIYVGKLGSLRTKHTPNQCLATGCQSVVWNELFMWVNPLESSLKMSPSVAQGVHYTLGSVLDETKDWLLSIRKGHDFVDPEIGHMAKASLEGGTGFGYLHIVSDNLAQKYKHDLSNERLAEVLQGRKRLVLEIQEILGRFFDQWSPKL